MNFLAHIYLSFGNEDITIGNFIADSIRGNRHKHLPINVQKGIMLHRAIDTFTDSHPTVRMSTKRLHENYSHYSGVIVDIFYDHFLAKNWERYSDTPLDVFVERFYDLLEENYDILPDGVKHMMPYMISDNWIYNYSNLDGISRVLSGMNRRTKNKSKMNFAILDLETHYIDFEKEFFVFFDELITYSKQKYISICEK
ncbi:acyl carrier protein phosphodiesterase [Flavobacteriaceae bacterium KMM 6897]|nr:acyl carrier protein phosphodiesterase [Flavobacteriaceae bacterium KMM 6897]